MEKHQQQAYRTVVQGEASESEDEETTITSHRPEPVAEGVVVEGEASESEEEELDSAGNPIPAVPELKLNESSESIDDITGMPSMAPRQMWKPKHDTVLNRKLWESNLSFCSNTNAMAAHTYLAAARDISNCGTQLSKSHANIQDVSHNMRLLTNDLFNLDDRIDIIVSCKLLPDLVNISPQNRKSENQPASSATVEQAQAAVES